MNINYPIQQLIEILGFTPKENASDIFIKKYTDGYSIEVDFGKSCINYGNKIKCESKTTSNFSQPENWVVLECVDRLLQKGYKPENIILEKTWAAGHGTSGRLDVCVTRDDGSEYLLIECKTYGKEFDKALARMNKDGGQLFTYFKFSNKADIIMLYASELKGKEIIYRNEIVKIEEDYRIGDKDDFYEKWSKLTKDNGVFDNWVAPYNFESKAITINELKEIKLEDSSFIFNRFLEILRHNVVSDKGNAFNRIFTLFLCKIYDEKVNEEMDNELGFQWFNAPFKYEGVHYPKDNHRSFQIRLTDLYKKGMYEFLEKVVTDFSETEFNNRYNFLTELQRAPILEEFRKIRLEKNNEFAIKDVYDEQSFNDNAVVVKEIVELLQGYKLRYTRKQQYLSDFFELLLTTGLKQESGQFFTPVPIAQFIIKSLPIDVIVEEKLTSSKISNNKLLPYVMDYAAGSGHFVTEMMHEIQRQIDAKKDTNYSPSIAKEIRKWQDDHFLWAFQYIYGIEKDYRLVKVGKVGCYLHGDGLANVIHSDGLARLAHADYKGKLLEKDNDCTQDNKQFDIIVSNPPYSVSAFKNNASKYYNGNDFSLYNSLTDNSSEIECLFVERTKQLLKDGGIAGVILPSSILSNTGIYTKTREIIFKYFEIIAITELGSNTFMATGTNTVVLFLRRRNNYDYQKIENSLENSLNIFQDNTINGVEKPIGKYLAQVWESVSFNDYVTLLKKQPNEAIKAHEIYQEYDKKIKAKNEAEKLRLMVEKETEKLLYFILAFPQQIVLVKSGEKDAEKRFLGYEFSNRRGSEGIHPIQRGKAIDECTQLFDAEIFDNPQKASTYIYKAFEKDFDFPIDPSMQKNVFRMNLVDMMTFDRVDFEKNISLAVKKKVKIESKWELKKLGDICNISAGGDIPKDRFSKTVTSDYNIPVYSNGIDNDGLFGYTDMPTVTEPCITISARGTIGFTKQRLNPFYPIVRLLVLIPDKNKANTKYLEIISDRIKFEQYAVGTPQLTVPQVSEYKIPLPPKEVQEKIVSEIEVLEEKERKGKEEIQKLKGKIDNIIDTSQGDIQRIDNILTLDYGASLPERERINGEFPVIGSNGIVGYHNKYLIVGPSIIVGRKGSAGKINWIEKNNFPIDTTFYVNLLNKENNLKLLYYLLRKLNLENLAGGTGVPGLNRNDVHNIQIKIPLISEQQKIVPEIETIEKQIAALEQELAAIPQEKEAVLKKYL